jgi:hypothetical protein
VNHSRANDPQSLNGDRRFSGRAIAFFFTAIIIVLVAPWAPLYVQWPRWSDHEHFASLAFGWSHGLLPYRDFININFPGEVYLFWVLGHVCGWSAEWSIYAFDLACLAAFAGFLLVWSKRVAGDYVAGLGVLATYLSYYTTLSYFHAAQRDSHTALLALVCALIPMGWHGRRAALVTGLVFAVALVVRPHVIAFAPAVALSLALSGPGAIQWRGVGETARSWSYAVAAALVTTGVLWLPILVSGLWPDFLDAMRLNLYGHFTDLGGNGRPSPMTLLREVFWAKSFIGVSLVISGCGIVAPWARWRSIWAVTLATQLGGIVYIWLHPARHNYLEQPLMAAWALGLGLFVAEICAAGFTRSWTITLAIVLTIAFQYPRAQYNGSVRLALRSLMGKASRIDTWRRQAAGPWSDVPWEDYVAARDWIGANTSPETRIANAAWGINLASNLGRLPALPIEIPWLWYHRDSEPRIREALKADRDIVLVWFPDTFRMQIGEFPELLAVIQDDYEPVARLGRIELRRRTGHVISP